MRLKNIFLMALLLFCIPIWMTSCKEDVELPRISFDGKMAYTSSVKTSNPLGSTNPYYYSQELFVADSCTSTQLTSQIEWIDNLGHPVKGIISSPRFFADGERIIFLHGTAGGPGNIYTIDANGQNLTLHLNDFCQRGCDAPDISYDGSKIVFTRSYDIYVSPIDTAAPILLTRFGARPLYSKTEDKIIFTSFNPKDSEHNETYQGDIYMINGDGTGLQNITSTPERESALSWSRDGEKILITQDNSSLWYIEVSSGNKVFISEIRPSSAAWSVDGDQIAFGSISLIDIADGRIYRTCIENDFTQFIDWSW